MFAPLILPAIPGVVMGVCVCDSSAPPRWSSGSSTLARLARVRPTGSPPAALAVIVNPLASATVARLVGELTPLARERVEDPAGSHSSSAPLCWQLRRPRPPDRLDAGGLTISPPLRFSPPNPSPVESPTALPRDSADHPPVQFRYVSACHLWGPPASRLRCGSVPRIPRPLHPPLLRRTLRFSCPAKPERAQGRLPQLVDMGRTQALGGGRYDRESHRAGG